MAYSLIYIVIFQYIYFLIEAIKIKNNRFIKIIGLLIPSPLFLTIFLASLKEPFFIQLELIYGSVLGIIFVIYKFLKKMMEKLNNSPMVITDDIAKEILKYFKK